MSSVMGIKEPGTRGKLCCVFQFHSRLCWYRVSSWVSNCAIWPRMHNPSIGWLYWSKVTRLKGSWKKNQLLMCFKRWIENYRWDKTQRFWGLKQGMWGELGVTAMHNKGDKCRKSCERSWSSRVQQTTRLSSQVNTEGSQTLYCSQSYQYHPRLPVLSNCQVFLKFFN